MSTGRRLIINVDGGGWVCFINRDNSERDRCSDRMKGIRKIMTKKSRLILKRDLEEILTNEI